MYVLLSLNTVAVVQMFFIERIFVFLKQPPEVSDLNKALGVGK